MSRIDPASPVPLYFQLKQAILEQLSAGELRPGDQLPTESELCERHGMSRTPVRQALLELSREGLLYRRAGRGTFVTEQPRDSLTLRVMVPDERWEGPLNEAAARINLARPASSVALEIESVGLAALHDQLLLSVARGTAPDIALVDTVWVAELASRRYLFPLDELDADWSDTIRGEFFPPLVAACQRAGKLQAVPANADATVLWYRRDWLESEGLEPPATWQALVDIGRHFRRPEVRRRYGSAPHPLTFVGGRAGGETTTYQLLPLLWAFGANLVAQDRIVIDSNPSRAALGFLRKIVQQEEIAAPTVVANGWDGAWRELAEGRVAMALGGTYERMLIQTASGLPAKEFGERIGFAPLPSAGEGSSPTIVGGMAYAITQQCREPAAALELLRTALEPEALERLSRSTSQNTAHLRVAEKLQSVENDFLEHAATLFAGARARPALPGYDRVSTEFQVLVASCISTDEPIAELLPRVADRMSAITGLPVAAPSRAA